MVAEDVAESAASGGKAFLVEQLRKAQGLLPFAIVERVTQRVVRPERPLPERHPRRGHGGVWRLISR